MKNLVIRIALAFFALSAVGAEPPDAVAPSATNATDWRSVRSSTRRFRISGADVRENLDLTTWAEAMARKVERTTGLKLPPDEFWEIDIVLLADRSAPSSPAVIRQRTEGNRLLQSLTIPDYNEVDLGETQEALCRLLMDVYVFQAGCRDRTNASIRRAWSPTPPWLWQGMAQNLQPAWKARNSERVMKAWESGKLPSIATFLQGEAQVDPELRRAVHGVLVGWLLALPGSEERFDHLFARLGMGETISSEDVAAHMPGGAAVDDLDRAWDEWIVRLPNIVFIPGTVSLRTLDQLNAQLLPYPGDSGIPLGTNIAQRLELRDLIDQRRAEWMPAFAKSKCIRIQLLAVGRGAEFREVVGAYCRFLEALGQRKSARNLRRLLGAADRKLAELTRSVIGQEERRKE